MVDCDEGREEGAVMFDAILNGLVVCGCVVLLLLPPRYDPAIMLKDWLMRRIRK